MSKTASSGCWNKGFTRPYVLLNTLQSSKYIWGNVFFLISWSPGMNSMILVSVDSLTLASVFLVNWSIFLNVWISNWVVNLCGSMCFNGTGIEALLEVAMSKKCTPLWREAHFEVKMYKTHHVRTTFGRFRFRFAWQAQGIVHLVKCEQNVRFLSHFQKGWQAWDIWRGSAKRHFPWQAQYKRHLHRSC